MFSILYASDGTIHHIGPFTAEAEADMAARKAQTDGEFDIVCQRVYLMYPDHRMVEYSVYDLTKEWQESKRRESAEPPTQDVSARCHGTRNKQNII